MWRIPTAERSPKMEVRIISTYVENTITRNHFPVHLKDHLHLRGEYCICSRFHLFRVGSSPLTWRILEDDEGHRAMIRIISTYVENTSQSFGCILLVQDHLHLRGEYVSINDYIKMRVGSSPLTWRIQRQFAGLVEPCRIISTYVENTLNVVTS